MKHTQMMKNSSENSTCCHEAHIKAKIIKSLILRRRGLCVHENFVYKRQLNIVPLELDGSEDNNESSPQKSRFIEGR